MNGKLSTLLSASLSHMSQLWRVKDESDAGRRVAPTPPPLLWPSCCALIIQSSGVLQGPLDDTLHRVVNRHVKPEPLWVKHFAHRNVVLAGNVPTSSGKEKRNRSLVFPLFLDTSQVSVDGESSFAYFLVVKVDCPHDTRSVFGI